jgi:two-component system, LytTR family, sensor kinase
MKKSIVISFHLFYWLSKLSLTGLFIVLVLLNNNRVQSDSPLIKIYIIQDIAQLLIFYLFYLYLFPAFLSKKKHVKFISIGLISWVILTVPILIYFLTEVNTLLNPSYYKMSYKLAYAISYALSILYSGFLGCLLKAFINWYSEIRVKEQLVQKNLQSELALLKAQINPHFLFNTINNIDVLIEKDPKAASKYLKQLSEIMRFMLYETSSDLIPLTTELEYITKYIELQKIRTSNERFVALTISGENKNLMIAPAVFIPFIENAFKHSTNKKIEDAIKISIEISGNDISFTCRNNFDNSKSFTQEKSGLGIDLIKQRLHLLYNQKHQLDIMITEDQFEVILKIVTK